MNASAPAKLFIIGEYAVLEGAPAAVAALHQRAVVETRLDGRQTVETITDQREVMKLNTALAQQPLLAAVFKSLGNREELKGHSLLLDTSAFFSNQRKLGLGSSAALTTALVKALRPRLTPAELLALAERAHLAFQGGHGSGADIAVAALDSSIRFQRDRSPVHLPLPTDLYMLAIWTGVSASTRTYLEQLKRWRQAAPAACERHMARLRATAEGFFTAAETGAMLQLIVDYNRYLNEFSQDSTLNFYNEPHIALQKEVESAHCLYKPSGAGGGDFGIAFSAEKNDIENLAEAMQKQGRIAFRIDRST